MSHNTLKVNTNAFDVNSNQSLSTSTSSIQLYYSKTDVHPQTYPRAAVVGQMALFYNAVTVNTITGLTRNLYSASWIESITLANAGKYRLYARPWISLKSSTSLTGEIGFYWYDITNGVQIGNNSYYRESSDRYPSENGNYGYIEVGASAITIGCRIYKAANTDRLSDIGPYTYLIMCIEKLQD